MFFFRLYPRLEMSFEHNFIRKNFFLIACFCRNSRLSLHEMDKKYKYGGTISCGDLNLSLDFVISKCLDYTQYYMTLLVQCGHIVTKVQSTVTWLGEDQINVCFVTWMDYTFAFM